MTAEQALIEENKKDQRVRYITQDSDSSGLIVFWDLKPTYSNSYNCFDRVFESRIKSLHNSNISFGDKTLSDKIICIDDILPKEVPPIPEKWYIECTEDNRDLLNNWRLGNADSNEFKRYFDIGNLLLSENLHDNSLFYAQNLDYFKSDSNYHDYKEITLEQFKKYVLKEEPEEKEESQKEEELSIHANKSINPLLFSGRYIKTGRIEVPNSFDDSFESDKEQDIKSSYNPFDKSFADLIANHPIMSIPESEREESQKHQDETLTAKTLYPRRMWNEDRLNAINHSVKSYLDNDYCIPTDWIEERNELIETLNNL